MSNRGVYPLIGGDVAGTACAGFDAYSSTVFHNADALYDELFVLLESAGFEPVRADGMKARFYATNRLLLDAKGHQLLALKSGGANPHPHVECTGWASRTLALHLRANFHHRPTRIDHAQDRTLPLGEFDRVHEYAQALCKQHRVRLSYGGDWSTPDAGRTIYIGSRQSQVCVRIYEKGLEYAHKLGLPITDELRQWVRFELEFKPQTDVAKKLAPFIEGVQMWGSTCWTDQLASEVLAVATEPVSIRERRESNRERALRFMAAQYGGHLRALFDECQGDFTEFGRVIADLADCSSSQASSAA